MRLLMPYSASLADLAILADNAALVPMVHGHRIWIPSLVLVKRVHFDGWLADFPYNPHGLTYLVNWVLPVSVSGIIRPAKELIMGNTVVHIADLRVWRHERPANPHTCFYSTF